jgi:hypothetical protein
MVIQNRQKYCPKCKKEIGAVEKCELVNKVVEIEQNKDTRKHLLHYHLCPICRRMYITVVDFISYIPCDISLKVGNIEEILGLIDEYAITLSEHNREKLIDILDNPRINIIPAVSIANFTGTTKVEDIKSVSNTTMKTDISSEAKEQRRIEKPHNTHLITKPSKSINNTKKVVENDELHKVLRCTIYTKEEGSVKYLLVKDCINKLWNRARAYGVDYVISIESPIAKLCLDTVVNNKSRFAFNGVEYAIVSSKIYDNELLTANKKPVIRNVSNSKEAIIYVYNGRLKCLNMRHTIESVRTNAVDILSNRTVELNVEYCINCKKYFIDHDSLALYYNKNIFPSIKFSIIHEKNQHMSFDEWNKFSKLRLYGYNVIKGKLTTSQRHLIISRILDYGLMEKP